MNPLQLYFHGVVGKQRRKNRVAGVVMLVLCGVAAPWGLSMGAGQEHGAKLIAAAIIGIPVALIILGLSFRATKGVLALADPARIVWHYGLEKSGHVNGVMIGFDDGALHKFPLPLISIKEGFSQEAFELLHQVAPQARVGFSEELRTAFSKDPTSLTQDGARKVTV